MAVEVHASAGGANVLKDFLHAWAAALASRDGETLAGFFDETALFSATAPEPLLGRAQIRAYYENAPAGLRVQASPLCAVQPLPGLVHGIADVLFETPQGVALRGRLGLSLLLRPQGWRVSAYQLAVLPQP